MRTEVSRYANDRYCSAIHEAAHAVVHLHFGFRIEQIDLTYDGSGNCQIANPQPTRERLIGILAGKEADKWFLKDQSETLKRRERGWQLDLDSAKDVLVNLGCSGSESELEEASVEAARLVKVETNWQRIELIAKTCVRVFDSNFAEDSGALVATLLGNDVERLFRSISEPRM